MNRRFQFAAALAAATLFVGFAPAPPPATPPAQNPPALTGFKHDPVDVFGYYLPQVDVTFGKWQLSSINLGPLEDFVAYEKGKRDPPEYAPVMIEFVDLTSPPMSSEMGEVAHSVQRRVLPLAYRVAGGRVSFAGKDAVLGAVRFDGALYLARVKQAHDTQGQTTDSIVAMTGDVTVGMRTIRHVKFAWFGGD